MLFINEEDKFKSNKIFAASIDNTKLGLSFLNIIFSKYLTHKGISFSFSWEYSCSLMINSAHCLKNKISNFVNSLSIYEYSFKILI